ncbi:secretin [Marinobacter sp.]|uniref:secretin n=1 Tax=Marinobacter sp. TaxID=50741 RepID=UPI003850E81F
MITCLARYLLLSVALVLATPLAADPEVRTYTLDARPAGDVAQQMRELYPGNQVTITSRGQQMTVRAEPRILDELGRLIETMDVATPQLRITVRSGSSRDTRAQGGGASAHNGKVEITGERRVTTTRKNHERSLVIQDGQSAHITSGQVRTLPIAIQGGLNPGAILGQVETRSGFLVSPQVISDQMVELNIVSFENDPEDEFAGYETEAVVTVRRVKTGEWVELGSSQSTEAGNRSGITYRVGGDRQESQFYEVRVEVL